MSSANEQEKGLELSILSTLSPEFHAFASSSAARIAASLSGHVLPNEPMEIGFTVGLVSWDLLYMRILLFTST